MDVKSRRVEQGDQTRAELLEAAAKLFSARGYAATPIEEVARAAGVTKGALYHHFRDKPALFEAVLAEMMRSLGKAAQRLSKQRVALAGGRRRGFERFEAALGSFLDELCEPQTYRILLVDGPAVLGRERFDQVWIENSLVGVRRVLGPHDGGPGLPEDLVEPVSRLLLGGLQEAVLTIGHAEDVAEARRGFERGLLWVLAALHEKAAREQ